ncbi:MAG: hypothetical protein D6698_15770 [Gammaproteobacteria bacterium]|nr:MAG: hypothetical protein D6698_15770 [Gammaproteobacteria bacterium]
MPFAGRKSHAAFALQLMPSVRHREENTMRHLPVVILTVLVTACSATYTQTRPAAYYEQDKPVADEPESLFSSDAAVLSDEEIARILTFRYRKPELARIAILPFGWRNWSGWSEEMAISTDNLNRKLIDTLNAADNIYDASFLPSILVPDKKTVPYLREAAARYQADLLLIFRSACASFQKYRLFAPDKTRAYCNVEAVLLDVRTGLVPFTANATRSFDSVKTDQDFNLREAVLRSELNAISDALGEISSATVRFLSGPGDSDA